MDWVRLDSGWFDEEGTAEWDRDFFDFFGFYKLTSSLLGVKSC